MRIPFTKMHGLGNDFVLLNAVQGGCPKRLCAALIQRLADRRRGIGFDQLLIALPASGTGAIVEMLVFNADGTPAEQCGNGLRCFGQFVVRQGLLDPAAARAGFGVRTAAGMTRLWLLDGDRVRVQMGPPHLASNAIPVLQPSTGIRAGSFVEEQAAPISSKAVTEAARDASHHFEPLRDFLPGDSKTVSVEEISRELLDMQGTGFCLVAVSMGNPHAVLRVRDVASAPVALLGPALQRSPRFPVGVNVGFMDIVDRTRIRLRVYERGAGETQACGSGACAAVVAGVLLGLLERSVKVQLPGGWLGVEWSGNETDSVFLEGPVSYVFEGQIEL